MEARCSASTPPIAEIAQELALVQRESDRQLRRAGVPTTLSPDITELLVTTFRELRQGKTIDGKGIEPLSAVTSIVTPAR